MQTYTPYECFSTWPLHLWRFQSSFKPLCIKSSANSVNNGCSDLCFWALRTLRQHFVVLHEVNWIFPSLHYDILLGIFLIYQLKLYPDSFSPRIFLHPLLFSSFEPQKTYTVTFFSIGNTCWHVCKCTHLDKCLPPPLNQRDIFHLDLIPGV